MMTFFTEPFLELDRLMMIFLAEPFLDPDLLMMIFLAEPFLLPDFLIIIFFTDPFLLEDLFMMTFLTEAFLDPERLTILMTFLDDDLFLLAERWGLPKLRLRSPLLSRTRIFNEASLPSANRCLP